MIRGRRSEALYDPRRGGQPVGIERLELAAGPHEPARTNCFALYLIEAGSGTFWADAARFGFGPGMLLCFVPYQHIRVVPEAAVRGRVVRFHANFLCVETFHAEVGCSGVLFNDPYGAPVVPLDRDPLDQVIDLLDRIEREEAGRALAFREVVLAHLRVLLIVASRCKTAGLEACLPGTRPARYPMLAQLADLIEAHYCSLHAPADYARLMHVTPKALGRLVREQLGTTLTDLIRSRILTHAKWQFLHTLRPVKEVARELGFADELYFSRLFKKATGTSPTFFRSFETAIRGGSNLSMPSAQTPIRSPADPDQT